MPAVRRLPLVAALAAVALHMLVFDRGLGGDGWAPFAALESLLDDGDLWLEDDSRGVANGLVEAPGGHLVMQYPPGILLLDALPFLAGRAADALLPAGWLAGGVDLPPVGRVPRGVFFSAAAVVLARNAAVLLGLLALAAALGRLGFAPGTAAAAVALTFFGGPLVFYALVGMTHAPVFALACLALLLLVRQRESGGPALAFAAGLALGLATLVRLGAVAILAAALPAVGGPDSDRPDRLNRLALLAGFAAPLALLPLYWLAATGELRPPGYGGSWRLTAASPWNVLFSPRHGLFVFHPALLLAAAGLAMASVSGISRVSGLARGGPFGARAESGSATRPPAEPQSSPPDVAGPRRLPAACLASRLAPWLAVWFLAVAFLNGGWSEWANEGGYGQRFLVDALPALGVGSAWLVAWAGRRPLRSRWPARLVLAATLAATAFGYLLFFGAVSGLVPAPAPHPWPQRLSDYRSLVARPPGPAELRQGLERASFLARALAP